MRTIFMRICSFFGWCVAISLIIMTLSSFSTVSNTYQGGGVFMLCGVLVFVGVQVMLLRGELSVMEDRFDYLLANVSAYVIFAAVSMLMRPLLDLIGGIFGNPTVGSAVYTWLFAIYEFATFSNVELSWVGSSLIAHALMIVVILAAPLGMREYFFYDRFRG